MSGRTWRFQTARGVVTVRGDAIEIQSTPEHFLAGQWHRLWNGDGWERSTIVFGVGGFLVSLFGLIDYVRHLPETGLGLESVPYFMSFALFTYMIWSNHINETTIPLSVIECVTLNEEEGRLTITHESDSDLFSMFKRNENETKVSLRTSDDIREVREIFQLRGIDLEESAGEATETTYRVHVRGGVCFCKSCNTQVSPNDTTCSACGDPIRVKTRKDSISETTSKEPEVQS